MFEFTHNQNADASVIKLLKSLSINIAPATIIDELEKHPEYPSLLAISDVLMALGIENAGRKPNQCKFHAVAMEDPRVIAFALPLQNV